MESRLPSVKDCCRQITYASFRKNDLKLLRLSTPSLISKTVGEFAFLQSNPFVDWNKNTDWLLILFIEHSRETNFIHISNVALYGYCIDIIPKKNVSKDII